MKQLFAPWRMVFIERNGKEKGCVLCDIPDSKDDAESLVLHRGKLAYVVLNKYPYANGHLMVVPFRHINKWVDLTKEELLEVGELTQAAIRCLDASVKPEGMNIGVNLGAAGGAGIKDHVHQHIVPRWVGDINFMPLFSEVKVISEHLDATYKRLKEAWKI
jgi:ATP adenylyltransferase